MLKSFILLVLTCKDVTFQTSSEAPSTAHRLSLTFLWSSQASVILCGCLSCMGVQLGLGVPNRKWLQSSEESMRACGLAHCADEPAVPIRHHLWVRSLARAQCLVCRFHSGSLSCLHGHELSDRLLWTGRPWGKAVLVGPGLSAAVICICNYLSPFSGQSIVWPCTSASRKVCFDQFPPWSPNPMAVWLTWLKAKKQWGWRAHKTVRNMSHLALVIVMPWLVFWPLTCFTERWLLIGRFTASTFFRNDSFGGRTILNRALRCGRALDWSGKLVSGPRSVVDCCMVFENSLTHMPEEEGQWLR